MKITYTHLIPYENERIHFNNVENISRHEIESTQRTDLGIGTKKERAITKNRKACLEHLSTTPTPKELQGKETRREIYTQGSTYHVIHLAEKEKKMTRKDYDYKEIEKQLRKKRTTKKEAA